MLFTEVMDGSARLAAWRQLRQDFTGPQSELIIPFAQIKTVNRYLDYYTPSSWPNVFDIVNEGVFCQTGVTLIMAATMHNLGFIKTPEIQLHAISNCVSGSDGVILENENSFYNVMPGYIVDNQYMKENTIHLDSYIITIDKLLH